MNRIKKKFIGIINCIKFFYFLFKYGAFEGDSPNFILKVIQKFITLESPYYPNTIYLGRSITKSSELLGALIDSYFDTKSEITLNQILEVLKDDFIQRVEKNGRKQF